MKRIKNLKEQLRSEHTELPEGFGWDAMQADIYGKMKDDEPRNKIVWIPYMIILVGVAFIALLALFGMFDNNKLGDESKYATVDHIAEKVSKNVGRNKNDKNRETVIYSDNHLDISKIEPSKKENLSKSRLINNANSNHLDAIEATSNEVKPDDKYVIQSPTEQLETDHISIEAITHKELQDLDSSSLKGEQKNIIRESKNTATKSDIINDLKVIIPFDASNENDIDDSSERKMNQANFYKNEINDGHVEIRSEEIVASIISRYSHMIANNTEEIENIPLIENSTITLPLKSNMWSIEIGGGTNFWNMGTNYSIAEGNIYNGISADFGYGFSARINVSTNIVSPKTSLVALPEMAFKEYLSNTFFSFRSFR